MSRIVPALKTAKRRLMKKALRMARPLSKNWSAEFKGKKVRLIEKGVSDGR